MNSNLNNNWSQKKIGTFKSKIWTDEEEECLIDIRSENLEKAWKDISFLMLKKGYNKNSKQCRERWSNYINPSLEKEPLTDSEINTLFLLYHKHGTTWSKMSTIMKNRSDNLLKNTFYREIKRLVKELKMKVAKSTKQSTFYLEFTVNLSVLTKVGKIMGLPLNKIPSQNIFEIISTLKSLNNKKPRGTKLADCKQKAPIPLIGESSEDTHSNTPCKNSSYEIKEISNKLWEGNNNIALEGKESIELVDCTGLANEENLEIELSFNNIPEDINFDKQDNEYCNFSLWNESEKSKSSLIFKGIFEPDTLSSLTI